MGCAACLAQSGLVPGLLRLVVCFELGLIGPSRPLCGLLGLAFWSEVGLFGLVPGLCFWLVRPYLVLILLLLALLGAFFWELVLRFEFGLIGLLLALASTCLAPLGLLGLVLGVLAWHVWACFSLAWAGLAGLGLVGPSFGLMVWFGFA